MMAAWMMYAAVTSALLACAAPAAERVLRAVRRPARFAWAAALMLAAIWPLGALLAGRLAPGGDASALAQVTSSVRRASALVVTASESTLHVSADTVLAAGWIMLSAVLLSQLLAAFLLLHRRRRAWRAALVDDARVLLSPDTGPAVVGFDPMEVVLPAWALTLDEPLRALVLRHEEEHRRARDPWLLFAARVLVAAMPWNPAVIWMARRLRLAVELDCDARVLRVHPNHERYGMLLLAIAQRMSGRSSLTATAMSEPAHNLARRLHAMRTTMSLSRPRLIGITIAGAAAIAVACSIDAPLEPPSTPAPKVAATRSIELPPEPEKVPPGGVYYRYLKTDSGFVTLYVNKAQGDSQLSATARVPEIELGTIVADSARRETRENRDVGYATFKGPESEVRSKTARPERERPIVEPGVMGERPKRINDGPYQEFQVEQSARWIGGDPPVYPEALKKAGVEGEVRVSLVIDERGRVGAYEVLQSPSPLFTNAVRKAIPTMRFEAAQVGGKAVRQILEMPFVFRIK